MQLLMSIISFDSFNYAFQYSGIYQLGYSEDKAVVGAQVYDKSKEKAGFIAGKHIQKKSKWWFQHSKKDWVENETDSKPGTDKS